MCRVSRPALGLTGALLGVPLVGQVIRLVGLATIGSLVQHGHQQV